MVQHVGGFPQCKARNLAKQVNYNFTPTVVCMFRTLYSIKPHGVLENSGLRQVEFWETKLNEIQSHAREIYEDLAGRLVAHQMRRKQI